MEVISTSLSGVKILVPRQFEDERGYFSETWNRRNLMKLGIDIDFVQDNHSLSQQKETVRGLHCQFPPCAQDKLVRVVVGKIWDVAVDIRRGSKTFGEWTGFELSAENGCQILIPKGFLHGFVTLEDNTEVFYKCSDYYCPELERTVRFDDPQICIDWKINIGEAILSPKDESASFLNRLDSPFSLDNE